MNDLVVIENNKMYTTSNLVAEEFGIMHKNILEKIVSFTAEISAVRFKEMFKEFDYTNDRNRTYRSYKIDRDGYMFLVMNISNKKANNKKLLFIDAFNTMENILRNKTNSEWINSRKNGIVARRELTDTIKDFVDYATAQGSKSAFRYYGTITKETYKSLSLISNNEKIDTSFRDGLATMDLAFLQVAEYVAVSSFKECMDNKLHYKEIYQIAKNKVLEYSRTVSIVKISK